MKMNEIFQPNPDVGMELEIQNSLEEDRNKLHGLKSQIRSTGTESTEELDGKKFPPTDYFGGIRLSKTATYNVTLPDGTEKLRRTGRACATNPTYKNALVMTQDGRSRHETHKETYYTTRSFPVSNIEGRIRSVLNKDRERIGQKEIPQNQKVRNVGADGTIRDMNGYIVIAASKNYPFGTLIMTTLGPGRVYDRGGKVHGNHIDVYTNWPK